jgi:DNA mismatch repair protein MutL
MPIRVLSEATASRIAAGEVIERPASVVKELVENSLDAGATRVHIEVRDGGIRSIAVTDNGGGIEPGQIGLAFERFATSKIDDSSDLTGIRTLGFRGEALPSIASVATVETISRVPGQEGGVELVLEFGRELSREPAPAPPGTTVKVTGLFRNVPARLKFLGSAGAELTKISQLVASLALVHPTVAFKLTSDEELRLATPGDGDSLAALASVYGAAVARSMVRVDSDPAAAFAVEGLISSPKLSRSSRNYITLSVNGRWVHSRRLTFAVEQSFHGYLPERRFPVAVLEIKTPFEDVDVNVHPAKAEVRFLREDLVFGEIQRAIRGALSGQARVRPVSLAGGRAGPSAPYGLARGGVAQAPAAVPAQPQQSAAQRDFATAATWPAPETAVAASFPRPGASPDRPPAGQDTPAHAGAPGAGTTHRQVLPVLRVIGQAHETYILAEGPGGVYLIDQHAAHERVLYEDIRRRVASRSVESQPLLEPEPVDLAPAHAAVIEEQAATLSAAGFVIEPFGPKTALLRAVPKLLADRGQGRAGDWLIKLLDDAAERGRTDSWQDRLLYTLACHAAVRAGRRMTLDESRELIRQLEQAENPHACPHGRPTMVHMTSGQLEREFGRR